MPEKHLSTQFDSELSTVSSRVMEMGGLVETQVQQAVQALGQFNADEARQVIELEHRVNAWRSSSITRSPPSSDAANPPRATCVC